MTTTGTGTTRASTVALSLVVALTSSACHDAGSVDAGSDADLTDVDDDAPPPYTGPPTSLATCDPADRFPGLELGVVTTGCDSQGYAFDVLFEATAWTGTGRLLVVDPTAPDSPELHVIETWTWDPCGLWDELRASVRTDAGWSMGASTAFGCEALDADPPVYTFAAWVTRYLDDDAVADCVVWGPAADDVRAGAYDRFVADLEGVPIGTLAHCRDRD